MPHGGSLRRLAVTTLFTQSRLYLLSYDFIYSVQQALTKDLPASILVQTEELANRKNQIDGDTFPQQVGQVSLVSAMRFIRLPIAGRAGRLQQPCFQD